MPSAELGDTLVLCRPEQLREAAIVLSCAPPNAYWPVVTLEAPPIAESEYRERYDAYRKARDARDSLAFGITPATKEDRQAAIADVDALAEKLTDFRVWSKRGRITADLLRRASFTRAILLFEFPHEELNLIDAIPTSRISERRQSILPENIATLELVNVENESLAAFSDGCREKLGGADGPAGTLTVAEKELPSYFIGLAHALRAGMRIRPATEAAAAPAYIDLEGQDAAEAVVIEVRPDAALLLGVIYARRRGARLIVRGEPDLSAIETARLEVQRERQSKSPEASKALRDVIEGAFDFFTPGERVATKHFREAISAAVPQDIVDLVGDRALTAFTAGVPYNGVKRAKTDWLRKPVGLIAGDASLLMLQELIAPPAFDATFGLLFDPGNIPSSESADVLAALRNAAFLPVTLQGNAASSLALTHLGSFLPLEFVFLNTHGSNSAVQFADVDLPAYKLAQRVTLPARPFVFNSSCQSWIGAGRAFVGAGARAYVGTLWNVYVSDASAYSRTVVARVANDGLSAAAAMRGTPNPDELAYVFVGTASARFGAAAANVEAQTFRRLRLAIRMLFDALRDWIAQSPANPVGREFVASPALTLWRAALPIWSELQKDPGSSAQETADDGISRLAATIALLPFEPDLAEAVAEVADLTEKAIEALPPGTERDTRFAGLLELRARLAVAKGDDATAITTLGTAIEKAAADKMLRARLYLQRSDALKASARFPEAIDAATAAYNDATAQDGDEALHARMIACGKLAQLSARIDDPKAMDGYTRDGLEIATQLDDVGEMAAFKRDLARERLLQGDPATALKLARESLELAAGSYGADSVAASYGLVTEALNASKRFDDAQAPAAEGLALARRMRDPLEVATFLDDFAEIYTGQNEPLKALSARCAQVRALSEATNRTECILRALDAGGAIAAATPGWEARRIYLETAIAACAALEDPGPRRAAAGAFFGTIYASVAHADAISSAVAVKALLALPDFRERDAKPPELDTIWNVLRAFDLWYGGQKDAAIALATILDQSWPGLGLGSFLTRFAPEVK